MEATKRTRVAPMRDAKTRSRSRSPESSMKKARNAKAEAIIAMIMIYAFWDGKSRRIACQKIIRGSAR